MEDHIIRQLFKLYQSYGLFGFLRLLCNLLSTKLIFPNARLIRRPCYIRGKRWMRIGSGFVTGTGLRLDAFPMSRGNSPVLSIGRDVQVNDYVHIAAVASVVIGDRVLIASKVFITDHNHGMYNGPAPHSSPKLPPADRPLSHAPVHIGDDVWIGEFVSILPGVTIGTGAVIGTMSTVTRDVPPYTIAAGSPARLLKCYNFKTSTWDAL